jgi:hypothetical protein
MLARIARATWPITALVAAVLAAVPWAFQTPQPPSAALDASYQVAIGQASRLGLVMGRDLVFTYGPLGSLLFSIQAPTTYAQFVVGTLALALVFACLFMALARRSAWPPVLALLVFVGLVLAMSLPERRVYALAVLLLAYLYDERAPRSPLLVGAATVLVGVLGLAKFTLFALGLGLYGILALADLVRRRLDGAVWLLVLVIVWPLGWLAVYGSLDGFLTFVSTSSEVSRGHNASHGVPGPHAEVTQYLVLLAPSLALAVATSGRSRAALLAHLASLVGFGLVVFKHAFVRHDVHALIGWSTLVAVNTVALVAGTERAGLRGPRRTLGGVLLAARLALVVASVVGLGWWSTLPQRRRLVTDVVTAIREVPASLERAGRLATGSERPRLEAAWDDAMAQARDATPLPPIAGGVDLYGGEQTLLFANHLDWRPRPVFQSYLAYTQPLLDLNATHLARHGADTVLFALRPIDRRLPATFEGPSWPVILSRYAVDGTAGGYLLLHRHTPPGRVERTPLGAVETGFDRRVPVPVVAAGELVWARITVPPSAWGQLAAAAWKPARVFAQLEGVARRPKRGFRLVPEMAAAGFALSPFVDDTTDFAALADALPDGTIPLPRVTALRLRTAHPGEFGPVSITFERMRIVPPGRQDSNTPGHGS